MKKPKYEYRIAIIMILLTAIPIGATQLGWYLYGKQVGFDYGMIAGVFSVILAGYLMYRKGCLLYTSPSPRDLSTSRMPSSA